MCMKWFRFVRLSNLLYPAIYPSTNDNAAQLSNYESQIPSVFCGEFGHTYLKFDIIRQTVSKI